MTHPSARGLSLVLLLSIPVAALGGTAIHCDGVATHARGPVSFSAVAASTSTSFSAWFRADDKPGDWSGVLVAAEPQGAGSSGGSGASVWVSRLGVGAKVGAGVGFENFYLASTINTGDWHHVAFVMAGTVGTLYLDGVPGQPAVYPHDISWGHDLSRCPSVATLYIGASRYSTNPSPIGCIDPSEGFFAGSIDEVCIWNRALTPEEVQSSMLYGGTTIGNGLSFYYRFDEGEGTTTISSHGASHPLEFFGAEWTSSPVPQELPVPASLSSWGAIKRLGP